VKDSDIVDCIVSPHDAPMNWEAIENKAGLITDPTVFTHHPISRSYCYN